MLSGSEDSQLKSNAKPSNWAINSFRWRKSLPHNSQDLQDSQKKFLQSAKGAARTSQQFRNDRAAPVLREFLQSAKGAARTSQQFRNDRAAPVLREFLQSAQRPARPSAHLSA